MKKLASIALMSAVFSTPSMAVTTVKVFDGTVKECKSQRDVVVNRNGVYRAKALDVKTVDQEVSLTVKLEFLSCEKTSTGYKFVHKDPYDNSEYETFNFEDGMQTVSILPINGQLKVYQDGVFKLIEQKDLKFEAVQNHVVKIDLADLKAKPNVDLSIAKEVIIDSEDFQMLDVVRYGAYRVHFDVKNSKVEIAK